MTSLATWQSSNPAVASVASTGEVTAVDFGTVTITARYGGVSGSQQVAVRCGVFLNVVPAGPLQVNVGSITRLQTFADFATPMYEQVFAMLSPSRTDVARVEVVPQTADWRLTAITPGQTTIHAAYQCGAADLIVTVTN